MPAENHPSTPDWSSLTADDANWLNELELDELLSQSEEIEMDWLADNLGSITGGTTVSMGAPSLQEHALDLDLPEWESITASSAVGDWTPADENNSSDWTDIPSSVSEMARQEAEEWDEKDQLAQVDLELELDSLASLEAMETQDFVPTDPSLDLHPPAEDVKRVFTSEVSAAVLPPSVPDLDAVFADLENDTPTPSPVHDTQESEFARPSYLDSFAPEPSQGSSFGTKLEDINIDIDLDLEDFRSSAAANTPPLHETFAGTGLPPLPSRPEPPTDGEKRWTSPLMSTGLNPDRKPFEPAPPALITEVSGVQEATLDIFSPDENTDWSGLVGNETPVAPPPAISNQGAPAIKQPSPLPVPEEIIHREVRQFQELLDESNLSVSMARAESEPVLIEREPLHSRVQPPPAKPQCTMPQLPWRTIIKVGGLGLGAIALVWVAVVVLDRPLTQLGLRAGWWKDVSGRDLSGMDLSGGNMRGANLTKADLRGANLENADLSLANLSDADLKGANLTKATIRGTNFQGTRIGEKGTPEETKLDSEAYMVWQAVNRRLDGLNLSRLNLLGVNLNNASLIKANLSNSNLAFATFRGANLTGANLRGAILERADFSGANLSGANLRDVNLGKNPPVSTEATTCPDRKKGPCKFEQFR
ncbi:MAG: pentapeptide repeat-containing protein [Pseudanabaenaceae cyanobacterium]